MLRNVHRSSSNNFMKCRRGNFKPQFLSKIKSIRKIYPQNLSAKSIRKIYPQNLSAKFIRKIYPQNLSAIFIRKIYPQNLSAKSIRKIYPQNLSAIRNPYPHFLPDLHKVSLHCLLNILYAFFYVIICIYTC